MLRHLLMLGVAIGAAGQALHNTKELNLDQTPSGGCSYDNSHLIEYSNIGSMTWAGCVTAASEYGLMMTSGFYTVRGGWLGLRVGSKAMIEANYYANPPMTLVDMDQQKPCVLGRDSRVARDSSHGHTPLSSPQYAQTSDGLAWRYQDLGQMYYDECQLKASETGTVIIAPSTLDDNSNGGSYWVFQEHSCNVYQYTIRTNQGNSLQRDSLARDMRNTAQRSSAQHGCLVGHVTPATFPPSFPPSFFCGKWFLGNYPNHVIGEAPDYCNTHYASGEPINCQETCAQHNGLPAGARFVCNTGNNWGCDPNQCVAGAPDGYDFPAGAPGGANTVRLSASTTP